MTMQHIDLAQLLILPFMLKVSMTSTEVWVLKEPGLYKIFLS